MEHRFERLFFGIMMIGGFFIISAFGGDLVDTVVQIRMSKIKTFEDLAKTNVSKITVSGELVTYQDDLFKMLR